MVNRRRYSFKPALLCGAQDWVLDETILTGPARPIDLRDVTRAVWVERVIRRNRFTRLDLHDNEGRISIAITTQTGQDRDDPDRAAHRGLCRAVAGVLAELEPDLPVVVGEYGRAALAMFVIGALTLLAGIALPLLALATGVSGGKLAGAAVPIMMLLAMGGVFAWTNRPWKPEATIPAAALPALLLA